MTAPRILLLGPPGAGKGTQSTNLVDAYDVEHVETGGALRANPDMETDYGTPREYMDAGKLVPDPVVNELIEAELADAEGFVLDGYPRTMEQVEYLEGVTDLDVVLSIEVSRDELMTRLTGRRVCSDCGTNFHVEYDPPAEPGVCDACGGELIRRDDDKPETVETRIEEYEAQTEPVLDHYAETGELVRIDGDAAPDEVWNEVHAAVERELKR